MKRAMDFQLPLLSTMSTSVHDAADRLPPSPVLRISRSFRHEADSSLSPSNPFSTPDGHGPFHNFTYFQSDVDVGMQGVGSYDLTNGGAPTYATDKSWVVPPTLQFCDTSMNMDGHVAFDFTDSAVHPSEVAHPVSAASQMFALDASNDMQASFPSPSWETIPYYPDFSDSPSSSHHDDFPAAAASPNEPPCCYNYNASSPDWDSDSDDDPTPPATPRQSDFPVSVAASNSNSASTSSSHERICSQCSSKSTPLWRHHPTTQKYLCNACGLLCRQELRPQPQQIDLGLGDLRAPSSSHECSHCHTRTTPVWRRNAAGEQVCNACGSYERLRGKKRPLHLLAKKFRPRLKGCE
ncbi:hypothetical protein C8J57DRAFT_1330994 [Mycena rebaudengoi]|nr:hypothetical protein C8J57DRAFT_1330994 [Mycena rebaudengoi]